MLRNTGQKEGAEGERGRGKDRIIDDKKISGQVSAFSIKFYFLHSLAKLQGQAAQGINKRLCFGVGKGLDL